MTANGNEEHLALRKKRKRITYVLAHMSLVKETFSFIPHNFQPPLLSLPSLIREEGGENERGSLSLGPECLAVFKWHTRTCFSLPRRIHCEGRWANTHPRSGHRLVCPSLCLHAGWQRSPRLQSQWVHSIAMGTSKVG